MSATPADRRAAPPPLTPELLLAAYRQGLFPMARGRQSSVIEWYRPDPRAVLPLDAFHCPQTLRAKARRGVFDVRHDTAFEQVVRRCAEPRGPGADRETWINEPIIDAYTQLHRLGFAHSIEAWRDGRLVGGLYGVTIGAAFCGESMFHDAAAGGTDASKICLLHLVEHLRARDFLLLDVQMQSPHMARFGAIEIPLDRYLTLLRRAIRRDASW
jgi:leucyl/phenylalanyl-tRNA--protein transferase